LTTKVGAHTIAGKGGSMSRRAIAAVLAAAGFLFFTTSGFAMTKAESQALQALSESFARFLLAGDSAGMSALYAPSGVAYAGASMTRAEIGQQYALLFGKQKNFTIRGIIIVGGKGAFTEAGKGKATGTITFRFTYVKGGKTVTADKPVRWSLTLPSGGGWQITEMSDLAALTE
jgi:hypothetical protein